MKNKNNEEMFSLVCKRVNELVNNTEVQKLTIKIAQKKSVDDATDFIYTLAIATLFGI